MISSLLRHPGKAARLLLPLALLPAQAAGEEGARPEDTIITSTRLEMRNDGEDAYFAFSENVRLSGTNLEVTCDLLEVFAEAKRGEDGSIGSVEGIRRIVASGNVVISQEGRRATAGRAEVLPIEDKIVLTEDPVVTDPQGTVAGERMVFYRGEQNAEIEKPRVVLRALPNLGFPRQPPQAGDDEANLPSTDPSTPTPNP